MHVVFWLLNRQLNVDHGTVSVPTQLSSRNITHIPDNVNVTNETSLHSNVTYVEEDEELESIPKSYDNMINNVQNTLDLKLKSQKRKLENLFCHSHILAFLQARK